MTTQQYLVTLPALDIAIVVETRKEANLVSSWYFDLCASTIKSFPLSLVEMVQS